MGAHEPEDPDGRTPVSRARGCHAPASAADSHAAAGRARHARPPSGSDQQAVAWLPAGPRCGRPPRPSCGWPARRARTRGLDHADHDRRGPARPSGGGTRSGMEDGFRASANTSRESVPGVHQTGAIPATSRPHGCSRRAAAPPSSPGDRTGSRAPPRSSRGIAVGSGPSRTVSRTKCARWPAGTNSWIDGGSSQPWSTSHGRNVLLMTTVNQPSPPPSSTILGQAPRRAPRESRRAGATTPAASVASMDCREWRQGRLRENSRGRHRRA